MNCQYCDSHCKKYGKQKDGTQKYQCVKCHKFQQENYLYNGCTKAKKIMLTEKLEKEYGIRTIARTLQISPNTVIKMNRRLKGTSIQYNQITERVYGFLQ